nr:hypothetical protein [Marseillevirus cajuinensis]
MLKRLTPRRQCVKQKRIQKREETRIKRDFGYITRALPVFEFSFVSGEMNIFCVKNISKLKP